MYSICEIFFSIQGESSLAGFPCVFIRFQGCNLKCEWCDTVYARDAQVPKYNYSINEILKAIEKYGCNFVCLTGGEPLCQADLDKLVDALLMKDYFCSLETNGSLPIRDIDIRVKIIMDIKTPSSGMHRRNLYSNIDDLKRTDEVKFVIANYGDYYFAKQTIDEYKLIERVDNVLLSPAYGKLEPSILAHWILKDRLPVRLNLQLHKLIWGAEAKGV